ncbi:DUF2975 domain-containing protein [Clostridium polynesiense]|uniref:DUF2975 domain-containing protein n=1 Tax=Clostridium polynesiense TaxID=1325933 RepID=UPI00058EA829|nr:DUF2975 domain-containing protein [Clostridium polynesiense]
MNLNMKDNGRIKWWLTWPVLIFSTILFWPVGIYLIWKRIDSDKSSAFKVSKLLEIIGWFLAVMGILFVIGVISDPEIPVGDISFGIVLFVGGGIALILLGKSIKKKAQRYKEYIAMIVNQRITSIDEIASAIPTSYDMAKRDIQDMIDKNFFTNAYINDNTRKLVLPKIVDYKINSGINANSDNDENINVTCSGCGAVNSLNKGKSEECEFCGSPLISR